VNKLSSLVAELPHTHGLVNSMDPECSPEKRCLRCELEVELGGGLERRIEAAAAFDKRHHPQNLGIHGVEFRFSLIGDVVAVSFGLSTGWHLPSVLGVESGNRRAYTQALHAFDTTGAHPLPMSMHFHVPEPIRDYMAEWEPNECDLLPGGKCYGDVTFTGADRPFFALVEGGLEGMWKCLADEAESFVGDAE
jgi:hypothetical protein